MAPAHQCEDGVQPHTHTHTHTHTRPRAHTHARANIHTHARAHAHTHARVEQGRDKGQVLVHRQRPTEGREHPAGQDREVHPHTLAPPEAVGGGRWPAIACKMVECCGCGTSLLLRSLRAKTVDFVGQLAPLIQAPSALLQSAVWADVHTSWMRLGYNPFVGYGTSACSAIRGGSGHCWRSLFFLFYGTSATAAHTHARPVPRRFGAV